jgi:hypothetical protein
MIWPFKKKKKVTVLRCIPKPPPRIRPYPADETAVFKDNRVLSEYEILEAYIKYRHLSEDYKNFKKTYKKLDQHT